MAEKEIIDYLTEGVKRGFSVEFLKGKLIEGGFDKKDVFESISEFEKQGRIVDGKIKKESETQEEKKVLPTEKNTKIENNKIGFFKKIGLAFAHPMELFEKTKGEGILSSLGYYLLIAIFPFVTSTIAVYFLFNLISDYFSSVLYVAGILAFAFFIAFPVLIFVSSFIVYLIVKIYRGEGQYSGTFKATAYSLTPQIFLFFVPGIQIWSFIIALFGLSVNHKISKSKAFLVCLTLAFVGIFIGAIFYLLKIFL